MTPFKDRVLTIVQNVPRGSVVSYGQVALYAGLPRSAREVGWVLRGSGAGPTMPWWRVINKNGRITINNSGGATPELQKKLLEQDGVEVSEDFVINMSKYRYIPTRKKLEAFQLSEHIIEKIMQMQEI